jgi:hypothetical protein
LKKSKARNIKEFISGIYKKNMVDYYYIDNVLRVIIKNEKKNLTNSFDKDTLESFQKDFGGEKNQSGVLSEIVEKVMYICSTYGLYKNVCFKFVDFETGQLMYDIKLPLQSVFIDRPFDPDFFTIYFCWHLEKQAYGFYADPIMNSEESEDNNKKLYEKNFAHNYLMKNAFTPEPKSATSKTLKIFILFLVSLVSTLAFLYFFDSDKMF